MTGPAAELRRYEGRTAVVTGAAPPSSVTSIGCASIPETSAVQLAATVAPSTRI